MFRPIALGLLIALAACDVNGGDIVVRGRVLDATTGEPLSPGPARVSVMGAKFLGPTHTLLSGEAEPDGRFHLSGEAEGYGEFSVWVGSAGRVEYPGTDSTEALAGYDPFRFAYFPVEIPYRQSGGTVELFPTCMTLGAVRFARPLRRSEQLRVRLVPVPDVPWSTRLYANGFNYEGSPADGASPPDSLRMLAVGGRPVVLEWKINEYNPPDGNGAGVFARGSVPLPTCPRHGVLQYAATLALPQ